MRRAVMAMGFALSVVTSVGISPVEARPYNRDVRYMPHPTGCPARLFCGCGAAKFLFGYPRRDLWLTSNWLRFRRVHPAMAQSRMVAVRRGHVFVLLNHRRGDVWLVYDANSGGHRTRIHERSIRGYTIVDPSA